VGPRYVFVENSPMLTSRGLGRVLGDLADVGYDAEWGVLGADDAGMEHIRKRIWILAYTSDIERRGIYRGSAAKQGYMGKLYESQSPVDRVLERIKRNGYEWEDWGAGDTGPTLCRFNDGMADNVDQLKAIGNGQVPDVVALAWRELSRRAGL